MKLVAAAQGLDQYADSAAQAAEDQKALAEIQAGLAKKALEDMTEAERQAIEKLIALSDELGNAKDATDELTPSTDENARALERATKQYDRVQATADEAAEAIARTRDEMIRATSQTFSLEAANLELDNAYSNLQTQQDTFSQGMADGTLKGRDAEVAMRDLRLAEIDLAESVLDAATKTADQAIAAGDTTSKTDLMKDALVRAAEKYPALQDEIQIYIDKLNAIPESKETTVNTKYTTTGAPPAPKDKFKPRAEAGGTRDGPGGLILVGEEGPEIVELPPHHRTIPADETAAILRNSSSSGAASGAGAGVVNYINITTGADPNAVVHAIEKYVKRNGPGVIRKWAG